MKNLSSALIPFIIACISFIISLRSFTQKGFLFNNAYIYASKDEKESMNKRPHYIQTAIAFFLLGFNFLLTAINTIWPIKNFLYLSIGIAVITIIYAVVSSIWIIKKEN